jgi:hypothetical protein
MRRIALIGAVLVVTCSVTNAAPRQGGATIKPQMPQTRDGLPQNKGTAVIRGRVTAIDTGRALRRVQVRINAPEIQETRTASTGSDGKFEIRDLPAGSYTVAFNRSGYLRLSYGQKRPGDPAGRLELSEGQVVPELNIALPRMSVISGRVFDEVGEPIAGVTVMPMQMRYYEGKRKLVPLGGMASTDDTGQYRLLGLEPGDYYVMATARETWESDTTPKETLAFTPTYFPSVTTPATAQRIKVATGQEAANTDISLIPGKVLKITGTAHSSTGTPLVGQTISPGQSFRSPSGFMSMWGSEGTKVAADGTFTLRNLAPGEYQISIRVPPIGDAPAESAAISLIVGGTDIEGLALTTSAGGQVTGRIVFDQKATPPFPSSRFRVAARPVNREFVGNFQQAQDNGRVREDWSFTLTGLMGANRVSLGTLPPGWAVKSMEHGGRDVTDAPLDFTSGEKLDDLVITLTDRFPTVSGVTTNQRGVPVDAMALVFAEDAAKWADDTRMVRAIRSDTAGAFKMRALPPGDYLAVALDYVVDGDWNDPQYLESLRQQAERLTVREGEAPNLALRVKQPS